MQLLESNLNQVILFVGFQEIIVNLKVLDSAVLVTDVTFEHTLHQRINNSFAVSLEFVDSIDNFPVLGTINRCEFLGHSPSNWTSTSLLELLSIVVGLEWSKLHLTISTLGRNLDVVPSMKVTNKASSCISCFQSNVTKVNLDRLSCFRLGNALDLRDRLGLDLTDWSNVVLAQRQSVANISNQWTVIVDCLYDWK